MNQPQHVEPGKLASKLRGFLSSYRIVIDDELLAAYADVLWKLTEAELSGALETATKENDSQYAPSPGQVYQIALEMRAGKHSGGALAEMAGWTPTGPKPEWIQDNEWQALKAKVAR